MNSLEEPIFLRDIVGEANKNTFSKSLWKAVKAMQDDGELVLINSMGRFGHPCKEYYLEVFLQMNNEQTQRFIASQERIANALEELVTINKGGAGAKRETKVASKKETKTE